MKLPNGYGSVVKLSGKRRKPYQVRKTVGWHYDEAKDKQIQDMITIGYAATRAEGLQMLADYNNNPFDTKATKMTFSDVYEEWSKRKFPTISESNVKGYTASYKSCEPLYNKIFKDIKLVDLQTVIDTCGKNFPTLKKIKVLFNQLFDYALKNDICNKDYSSFVDIVQYKDRNPNKYDRNKFEKNEIDIIWEQKEDKYYQIVLMLLYSGVRISEMLDLKKENVHLKNSILMLSVVKQRMVSEKFQQQTRFCHITGLGMNPALNVNIYFIQKPENILNTETTMIAISSH